MSKSSRTHFGVLLTAVVLVSMPSLTEAQIGVMELQVQHWGPDIDVVVTQNGKHECYHPRPIPDATSFIYLWPEIGDTDFSNYMFDCGPIDIQYAVQLTVLDAQVVDSQLRPTLVEYHTGVYAVQDGNWVSLLDDIRIIEASEGELLLEQGRGASGVPGVIFYGARDASKWTFY